MKALKNFKLILSSLLLIFVFSCNDSDSSSDSNSENTSRISIRLSDAPGDYEKVLVHIIDIMIKNNDDGDDENGWQSIADIDQIVDLLELTGGESVLLVDDFELPSGMLNQIRLVLGEENTIVIVGEEEPIPLKTPSAQQSGLKLKVNHELEPGFTYNILLDFDVHKSIVIAGNSGNIILKPVIRASTLYGSGKIQGTVNPSDIQVLASVVTVDGGEITADTDDSGVFVLNGVPAGTYTVVLTPDPESDFVETVVDDVGVVNGVITYIEETIDLEPKTGSITGTIIINEGVVVTASVMVDGSEVTADTNGGVFLLEDIPVGTYTVTLTPADGSGLAVKEESDVEVTQDTVTDIGVITWE